MFIIIGIIIVFGSVAGGYVMEHGQLAVLMQPAELVIIGGASIGTVLIANPVHVLKQIAYRLMAALSGSKFTKAGYVELLKTICELLNKARKEGMMGLEADIEKPEASPILSKNAALMKDHHARDFVCDSLRMMITGFEVFELDQLMDLDMEVHHRDALKPAAALTTMADALPGLGIVAAVLGVVITMGALGGPPEEIGKKVAAALVGTFLGVLLCYGLVGPLASNITQAAEEESAHLHVIRVLLISYLKGAPPMVAVEVARRAIPGHIRPGFREVEAVCRSGPGPAPAAGTPAAGTPAA